MPRARPSFRRGGAWTPRRVGWSGPRLAHFVARDIGASQHWACAVPQSRLRVLTMGRNVRCQTGAAALNVGALTIASGLAIRWRGCYAVLGVYCEPCHLLIKQVHFRRIRSNGRVGASCLGRRVTRLAGLVDPETG
jgi:hypothetical protein